MTTNKRDADLGLPNTAANAGKGEARLGHLDLANRRRCTVMFCGARNKKTLTIIEGGAMKTRLILFTSCAAVFNSGALADADRWAFQTGNTLFEMLQLPAQRAYFQFYVVGVRDTLRSGLCDPKTATQRQIADVVAKWLNDNPARRDRDGNMVAFTAITEAWPCPTPKPAPNPAFYGERQLFKLSQTPAERVHFQAYVAGVRDALSLYLCAPKGTTQEQIADVVQKWLREDLGERGKQERLAEVEKFRREAQRREHVLQRQIGDVVAKWLEENPGELDFDGREAVNLALTEAWPCPERASKP